MKISTNELQGIMQEFYHKNNILPNTLLMPAGESIEKLTPEGLDILKIESLFHMKVVYAAVSHPQLCMR